ARDPLRPWAWEAAGPRGQGSRSPAFPHASTPARLAEGFRALGGLMAGSPLVLVSNRGPVTFGPNGEIRRGTGGLVTALIGLASHREVTWIASAMTSEDAQAAEENGGRPFPVSMPDGSEFKVKLVASDPQAYDRFYNIIA